MCLVFYFIAGHNRRIEIFVQRSINANKLVFLTNQTYRYICHNNVPTYSIQKNAFQLTAQTIILYFW